MILHLMAVTLALVLDRFLGEPPIFHPLVGFGHLANKCEATLNRHRFCFVKGIFAWCLVVLPVVALVYWLDQQMGGFWLSAIFGWLAIGWKSLRQHGQWVYDALINHDLATARQKTSYLVSRDTSKLNETELSRATIESLLENGSDAMFAPLFWLLIGGAPLVVLYRLANTLDAMWGYRNERYEQFGKFTARMDDLLNLIPARITAFLYALSGNSKQALDAWKSQGKTWYSPNAGVVMASGAGALNLKLGGDAVYHGKRKSRPVLGGANEPTAEDIQHTLELIHRSEHILMFLVFLSVFVGVLIFGPEIVFGEYF